MARSSLWGSSLAGILRAQAFSAVEQMFSERSVAHAFGGGGFGAKRQWDPKGARRAGRSFGLAGGELCGCSKGGCRTCASDGKFGEDVCRCAAAGCSNCTPPWSAHRRAWGANAAGAASARGAKADWSEGGTVYAKSSVEYFCIHSHLSATTQADYDNTFDSSYAGTTEIEERIAMLESLQANYGVQRLVVSGLVGGEQGDPALDGYPLDLLALYATSLNPDYFVPFLRGFDINAPDLGWIALGLTLGFRGIGELLCYGYKNELDSPASLVGVCRLAAQAYVPVAVHWEIGNRLWGVDEEDRTPSDVAWERLLWLLAQFPRDRLETFVCISDDDPRPFKLILCHGGSGNLADDATLVAQYSARVDQLLTSYPNVYFDMAGMQGPDGPVLYKALGTREVLTLLGSALAEKITAHPDRFLFGVDANQAPDEISSSRETFNGWARSIPNYETYLFLAGITDADTLAMFRYGNAERVLYSRAIEAGTPSTSATLGTALGVSIPVVSP